MVVREPVDSVGDLGVLAYCALPVMVMDSADVLDDISGAPLRIVRARRLHLLLARSLSSNQEP